MQYDYRSPAALYFSFENILDLKTPVSQLITDAHANAFNFICIPLTTALFNERWKRTYDNYSSSSNDTSGRHDFCFQLGEVNITRLG